MFRVKFNKSHVGRMPCSSRQMSTAKRLFTAQQPGGFSRDRVPVSATVQLNTAGKQPKKTQTTDQDNVQSQHWPRKIFSGIQPTGSVHLGNYLGAVRKWIQLQKARENVSICIVDMHSITMPHNPPLLRENIFLMAATLLACGVDPAQSTLFVQSSVLEHCEFNWILNSLTTMPRLSQLPQFKEKSRMVKDVPLGLFVYPVLQAADIMLYKATHVPVGIDQLQHIQLAQHLTRSFNTRYGEMFPVCSAMIEENDGSRILSLREPTKKMSKSEANQKATINLNDAPEAIREKIKKAMTDFTSDISYSPKTRPGVSNLVNIHAQVTGQSIASVVEEAKQLDTAKYKERVADAVIEHLRPIREKIEHHLTNRNELTYMLEMGSEKARIVAQQTMSDVKQRLGLGTYATLPPSVVVAPPLQDHPKFTASQRFAKGVVGQDVNSPNKRIDPALAMNFPNPSGDAADPTTAQASANATQSQPRMIRRTVVPMQSLRVEKGLNRSTPRHVFKLDSFNAPKIGFQDPNLRTSNRTDKRESHNPVLGFSSLPPLKTINSFSGFKYGNSNTSALASVTSQVNAVYKQQEMISSLANSAYYKAAASSYNNPNPSVVNAPAASRKKVTAAVLTAGGDVSNKITMNSGGNIDSDMKADDKSSSATINSSSDTGGECQDDDEGYSVTSEPKIEKLN